MVRTSLFPLLRGLALAALLMSVSLMSAGCGDGGEDAEEPAPPTLQIATEEAKPVEEERLELKLAPGDRFPLLKTVEQTVTQRNGSEGVESRSSLEMLMAITVEDVRPDGRKLFNVRYQRVRYVQEIDGERVEFDSTARPTAIPPEVAPYRRLVDNGFSFWLGPDNRIDDLVGFDEFLKRCVQDVPPARRGEVLAQFARTSSEEGIANFVDDSIGVLPYADSQGDRASVVRVGSSWRREQRYEQPMPVYLRTEYTLRELTDEVAHVDMLGTIGPATTFRPTDAEPGVLRVHVRNGHSFGTCAIRRDTGLPVESRMERLFDMIVQMPKGERFAQQKRIITTIRTFQQQQPGT